MNVVLRKEKKYILGTEEYMKGSAYLDKILHQDPNNGAYGYNVRSLYFDTVYDTDFFEKTTGIELRRKVRLRIYDPAQETALLEMKQKQGSNQLKRSLKISKDHAKRLIDGDFSPLLSYKEEFAQEMYGFMTYRCYRPKTVVEYVRKAFVAKENRIRITFDRNIFSTESNFDLFSPRLTMNPVLDPYYTVLEVKYHGFLLSYIKQLLSNVNKSELSVSKYYLARQNGYRTHF